MKIIKFLIVLIFLNLILIVKSNSEILTNIKLMGNKQIQLDTVLNKIKFSKNKDYSISELNLMQKKLFDTGFFENVTFEVKNQSLIIVVKENPIIDFFYIYGDQNKERLDKIYDLLNSRTGNLFSDFKLLEDVSIINQIYKFDGYYNAKVEPLVKKINDNKVNITIKIEKGNKYKINKIYFIGNKVFKPSTLKDEISSTENGWWKILSTSSLLNEERIEYDKRLLKNFYANQGYYDNQIVTAKIEILENNFANILFSIESGPKYRFGNISYNNTTFFNEIHNKFLQDSSNKLKNKFYSISDLNKLKNQINNFVIYNKFENLDFKISEIKEKNNINIEIIFFEKKIPVVKNILVKGNSITEEKVIRNNLSFSEGDIMPDFKLSKAEDNLKSIGIFKNVKIKKNLINDNFVNVEVEVVEQPTGSIMGGVGIGSNEAALSFSISEKNLFGSNIFINTDLSIGTQKIEGRFITVNPDFKDSGNKVKNNFYAESTYYDSVGYESSLVGNDISVSYDIYDDISFHIGLGADYDKIKANSSASAVYKNQAGNYSTIKTFYGFSNDKRNRKFNTTDGYIFGFNQTLSVPPSDIPYIQNNIYAKKYFSLDEDYVLNFRTGFSSINGYSDKDVKLSNRLFTSTNQLRGFEPRGIGPVEGNDHIGGNYSAYAGLSSTFPNPIPEKWNATTLLFLDSANLWGVDYDSSKDSDEWRSSFGVALNWTSPLGPISFTLSTPLKKKDTDNDETFSFLIGSAF